MTAEIVPVEHDVWHFTMKRGKVKSIGLHHPAKELDVSRTDASGSHFFDVPLVDPKILERLTQAVRGQFGDDATGEGYCHQDHVGLLALEFAPETQS